MCSDVPVARLEEARIVGEETLKKRRGQQRNEWISLRD